MKHKRVKRTDDEWRELIRQCQASGMSMRAWCREHGISESTFYNRISRMRNSSGKAELPVFQDDKSEEQHVIQWNIIDDGAGMEDSRPVHGTDPAVTLTIGRCRAVVHNCADRETIQHTLYALQQIC